jgi:NAD(P)-dependent dehydrogenase (short-subunit alcohol dehydrogenase family)
MKRLEGKVAIVTGAGRGIGKAVAELMAEEGASIVVNDLGSSLDGSGVSKQPADEVVESIKEKGGNAVSNADSVSDFNASKQIINCALDNFGKLDILVNCAGILRDRMIFNMTEEEWDSVIEVHLKGTFNMVKHSVEQMMLNRYGRIVLCASSSGLGSSGQANYAAAKEGIVGFSRAIASEVLEYGININSVYPGGATRMTASIPQTTRDLRKELDAKKKGTDIQEMPSSEEPPEANAPENNAPKMVYLCTDPAGEITGQVFGTYGWNMSLYSPRHVTHSINKVGNWSVNELSNILPISLAKELINPVPKIEPKEKK